MIPHMLDTVMDSDRPISENGLFGETLLPVKLL